MGCCGLRVSGDALVIKSMHAGLFLPTTFEAVMLKSFFGKPATGRRLFCYILFPSIMNSGCGLPKP